MRDRGLSSIPGSIDNDATGASERSQRVAAQNRRRLGDGTLDLDDFEHFDHIANANVVVVLHADTTFHTVTDFVNVIFEAAQGFQLAFIDNHVVAQNADWVMTFDRPFGNHTARDSAKFRRFKDITDFSQTDDLLFQFRREHTAHRRFHFVDQVIDDGVVAQIRAFRFDNFTCRCIGTYVEADQMALMPQPWSRRFR